MASKVKEWRTAEGDYMAIKDMDDQHLVNATRMLERNASAYKQKALSDGYQVWGMVQGEQAEWDIERDINMLEEMTDQEFLEEAFPVYKKMLWHIKRRGLTK